MQASKTSDPQDVLDILSASEQASRYLDAHYEEWKEQYPDHWVAVSRDGLIAANVDAQKVVAAAIDDCYSQMHIAIKFLDSNPRLMLL